MLSPLVRKIGYFSPLALVLFLLFGALQPVAGLIGHDYYHQLARFYIGAFHFWQNGLAVPHSAALCGGLPFFADPQSAYYSLPQFFVYLSIRCARYR